MKRFAKIVGISTLIVLILVWLVSLIIFPPKHIKADPDFPQLTGPYLGQQPPGYRPERFAPDIVNDDVHTAAVFSPDGQEVYWRPMDEDIEDILFMHREENGWTPAQVVPFASRFFDTDDPCFSADGEKLFFTSWRPIRWYKLFNNKERIWYVERTAHGWSKAKPVGPAVNTMALHWQFSVADDNSLYFASEGDIYHSRFKAGQYVTPEQVGNTVNTEFREDLPFAAPNSDYLLFASDRPGGMGDFDLYISLRDSDGSWLPAANAGDVVNSRYQELYPVVSPDGKYLFFLSNRGGFHSVYWVDLRILDLTPTTLQTQEPTPPLPLSSEDNGEAVANPPPNSESLVLFGTLIDGTGADPISDAALVIQDGHIIAVGPREEADIPTGAKQIEVPGATILPGFINAHVHDTFDQEQLAAWAWDGVTTVRDEGILDNSRDLETLMAWHTEAAQQPQLARLVSAGYMIGPPGGYGQKLVSTSKKLAQTVADECMAGVDLIKFAMEDGYAQRQNLPVFTDEEIAAIVTEAHARGKRVSVHVTDAQFLPAVLDAGVDDIAHIQWNSVSDALIAHLVEQDVYVVPTLTVLEAYGALSGAQSNLRRFVDAGVPIALGNDYTRIPQNNFDHFDLGMPMHEIQRMSEAGMTPMQIIVAATRNAAHICDLENKLGTLEVGKLADVLVVDGDPLQDLQALKDVHLVIHGGVIIRDERSTRD